MPDVSAELYEVISLAMRYVFAFLAVLMVLRAFRLVLAEHRTVRGRLRKLPDAGAVGELMVLRGSSELPENTCLPVGREGTLGSVRGCDLFIPCRGIRRSHLDYIWEDGRGLLLTPRRGCAAAVNGVPVDSRTDPRQSPLCHGGILTVGDAILRLHVFTGLQTAPQDAEAAASGAVFPVPEAYPAPPQPAVPVQPQQPASPGYYGFPPQSSPAVPETRLPARSPSPAPETDAAAPSGRVRRSDRWKEDWSE